VNTDRWAVASLAAGTYLVRLSGLLLGRGCASRTGFAATWTWAQRAAIAAGRHRALTQGEGFAGWARPIGVPSAVAAWRRCRWS